MSHSEAYQKAEDYDRLLSFLERTDARIDIRDMWVVRYPDSREWVIYQRKRHAKTTKELVRTTDLRDVIVVLEYNDKKEYGESNGK